MANQYNTSITPLADPGRSNVYLIKRPTFVTMQQMGFNINLFAGQSLRLRETVTFGALRLTPYRSMLWVDRPFDEAFMGSYVITKQLENNSTWASVSQKIIGIREPGRGNKFSFTVSYEWDFRFYLESTDRPTTGTIIRGCNTELAPSTVSNANITPDNALQYAKVLFLLGKKQLAQATSAILALSQPVIAGYRFGDGTLFYSDNQIAISSLGTGQIPTAIGDIWVKLAPDWAMIAAADYDIRAINFAVLEKMPVKFQFPPTIECALPANYPKFPSNNGCYGDFQSFLFSTLDAYPSYSQALVGRGLKGVDSATLWVINEKEWLCPNDNADIYSYWQVELKDQPPPPTCAELLAIDQTSYANVFYTLGEAQAFKDALPPAPPARIRGLVFGRTFSTADCPPVQYWVIVYENV